MPVPTTRRGQLRRLARYPHRWIAASQVLALGALGVAALVWPHRRRTLLGVMAGTLTLSEELLLWRAEVARRETGDVLDRLRFLEEASEVLADVPDMAEALYRVAALVVLRDADWCVIDLDEHGRLARKAEANRDPAKLPGDPQAAAAREAITPRGPIGRVYAGGQSLFLPRLPRHWFIMETPSNLARRVESLGLRSLIAVPIRAYDQTLGVLTVGLTREDRRFDDSDFVAMRALSQRIGLALTVARLREETGRGRETA